jgi:selenocysteine lyase/cysteine desulfurase
MMIKNIAKAGDNIQIVNIYDHVVITTHMEYLSDYLPWKFRCETVLADVKPDGRLSLSDLARNL